MSPRVIYPHYVIWLDEDSQLYEVARWDGRKTVVVVQTNIRTYEKATRALADWKKRAGAEDHP